MFEKKNSLYLLLYINKIYYIMAPVTQIILMNFVLVLVIIAA